MNKLIIGGERGTKIIYKKFLKECEMKRLISFVSINNDFSVELFEGPKGTNDNSIVYRMIFSSNCERVDIQSNDLCEICGQIFSIIEKNGKVTEVIINNTVICEEEIVKIEFDNKKSIVKVYTFDEIFSDNYNNVEIDTISFDEDCYKESILDLRREINKLYKKVAA